MAMFAKRRCQKEKTVPKARWNNVFLFCTLVTLCTLGCDKQSPPESEKDETPAAVPEAGKTAPGVAVPAVDVTCPLTGHWRSVKLEGADIGNFIKEIRYTFGADGSFVAEAAMNDGSTDTRQGVFRIEGNRLLRIVDGSSVKAGFTFENGTLIIHDPFLDTKIWLEKEPSP